VLERARFVRVRTDSLDLDRLDDERVSGLCTETHSLPRYTVALLRLQQYEIPSVERLSKKLGILLRGHYFARASRVLSGGASPLWRLCREVEQPRRPPARRKARSPGARRPAAELSGGSSSAGGE
jgi:hypothetical protein